jgi:hypothetical protein
VSYIYACLCQFCPFYHFFLSCFLPVYCQLSFHFLCYFCLLEVIGGLFHQSPRIMPLPLICRSVISSVLLSYITFPLDWLQCISIYLWSLCLYHILYCRGDLFFQLLVILVHIAGMWYVSFQGEYIANLREFPLRKI